MYVLAEISLVVIMRLKTVAASSTLTGLRRPTLTTPFVRGTFGKFRKRIIAFTAVAILIRRIQMDNILICVILCSAPPGNLPRNAQYSSPGVG